MSLALIIHSLSSCFLDLLVIFSLLWAIKTFTATDETPFCTCGSRLCSTLNKINWTLCLHSSLYEHNCNGHLRFFSATLGSLEFGLHYDQESNSLHCSILKAKVGALFGKGTFIQYYSSSSFMEFLYWYLFSGHDVMISYCFCPGSKAHGLKWTGRSLCQTPSAARGP